MLVNLRLVQRDDVIQKWPRICIIGGPKTGKTTLAEALGGAPGQVLFRTDDLMLTHEWSAVSDEAMKWLDEPGPWVCEGVATVRAIRKWLAAHSDGKPCDGIVYCTSPLVTLIEGQRRMSLGVRSIFDGILPQLTSRYVPIRYVHMNAITSDADHDC